ncbi:hypothetical protein O3M35_002878 [Rhynocoris fuscipes]|uniref:Uncharacterized protein n=1 Tax=Rhynocoris fuscipes TaxID=488301 RepID=A0AAW1CUL9_9HEMI
MVFSVILLTFVLHAVIANNDENLILKEEINKNEANNSTIKTRNEYKVTEQLEILLTNQDKMDYCNIRICLLMKWLELEVGNAQCEDSNDRINNEIKFAINWTINVTLLLTLAYYTCLKTS